VLLDVRAAWLEGGIAAWNATPSKNLPGVGHPGI
jgi:hypothetical protein